jgi:hypothetical protein
VERAADRRATKVTVTREGGVKKDLAFETVSSPYIVRINTRIAKGHSALFFLMSMRSGSDFLL